MSNRSIETEIEINASANKVWRYVGDVGAYGEWNPFITAITGDFEPGKRVRVVLKPPKGPAFTMRPYVKTYERPNELSWHGRLYFDQVFHGTHQMIIEKQSKGVVKFIHREDFGGFLLPVVWWMLRKNTRAGFEAMNAKLKELCEQ